MHIGRTGRVRLLGLVAICVLIISATLLQLDRQPPLWWDEGWTLVVARNWAVDGFFGRYLAGAPDSPGLAGGFPVIAPVAASFRLLGVGVWQGRLPGVLCLWAAFALLYFLADRLYNRAVAVGAVVVTLINVGRALAAPVDRGTAGAGRSTHRVLPAGRVCLPVGGASPQGLAYPPGCVLLRDIHSRQGPGPAVLDGLHAPAVCCGGVPALVASGDPAGDRHHRFLLDCQLRDCMASRHVNCWAFSGWQRGGRIGGGDRGGVGLEHPPGCDSDCTHLWPANPHRVSCCGIRNLFRGLIPGKKTVPREVQDPSIETVKLALLGLTGSWLAWFVLLGMSYPRYLFPVIFIGSIFTSALLYRLTMHFSLRKTVKQANAVFLHRQFKP